MANEPVIVFDTNCLKSTSWNAPAFRALVELSSQGQVKVFVPEIVFHERRTQWRDEFAKGSSEIEKVLAHRSNDPLLTPADRAAYQAVLKALPASDAEARSQASFDRYFEEAGFEVVRITGAQTTEAFKRYFAGTTPYKSIKARSDIPDGFVFAAMAAVADREGRAFCLCNDNQLVTALSGHTGITVFGSVEDVMQDPELIALRDELETNKAWLAARDILPMSRARAELTEWAERQAPQFLEGRAVWSEKIPSDDSEGVISLHDDAKNVTISDFNDWGGGNLTASISFISDVEIEFPVYRGDAYLVPEWVSVVEGDFEADHYFDATGSARVRVTLDVSFQAVIADNYDDVDEVLTGISLEREPRVRFLTGI